MGPVLYAVYGLAVVLLIFWASLWLVHIVALAYGKWRLHRRLETVDPETAADLPGVSVIKPICQSQETLLENLETFFTLKYPKYEILFCIQEVEDVETNSIVKKLVDQYPEVDVKIFRGGLEVGVNPKINNMVPAYTAAKYPLILVSDAGIKMKEDTLSDMVRYMKDDVGLVHQMPYICDRTGLASTLEKVYFGTGHARIYLSANLLGINCATGMSALMRKEVLDKAGGFAAFGIYLAEDFFFAKTMQDHGYHVVISSQPAAQNHGESSITYFQNRISRWAKLRAAMVPHTILVEPISECMMGGALGAWASYLLFRTDPVVFYLVHVLCWFLSDWVLIHIVQNGSLPFNKFDFMVMWLFRECGAPYIFLHSLANPAIRWRNLEFRLAWGGKAEAVAVKPAPATPYQQQPPPYTAHQQQDLPYSLQQHESYSSQQQQHEPYNLQQKLTSYSTKPQPSSSSYISKASSKHSEHKRSYSDIGYSKDSKGFHSTKDMHSKEVQYTNNKESFASSDFFNYKKGHNHVTSPTVINL